MKLDDRRQAIMDALLAEGAATVDDLADRFGVSKMTIHRDLDDLEQAACCARCAAAPRSSRAPSSRATSATAQTLAAEEKDRMAAAAALMVEPGQTIIIDDGSTAGSVARHLADMPPADRHHQQPAVIDRARRRARDQPDRRSAAHYSKKFHGFFGIACEEALRALRADVAFMSSSAIHGALGLSPEPGGGPVQAADDRRRRTSATCWSTTASSAGPRCTSLTDLVAFDAILTGAAPDARPSRGARGAPGVRLNIIKEAEGKTA